MVWTPNAKDNKKIIEHASREVWTIFDHASTGDLASSRALHHTTGGCTIDLQHCCWLFLNIVVTNHHHPDLHQYIQHPLSLFQQQQVEELDLSGYGRKTKGCLFDKHEKLLQSNSQGESTLPERIISKTKAPRQQQQEEPTGSPKTEGYGKWTVQPEIIGKRYLVNFQIEYNSKYMANWYMKWR